MKSAKEIFDFLPGRWRIDRSIVFPNNLQQNEIKIKGHGGFIISESDPNLILYSEDVIMYLTSLQSLAARQKYQYKYTNEEASIAKYFSDGQLFYHLVTNADSSWGGTYLCNKDQYLAKYIFESSSFTLTHFVRGPEKSYDILTQYTREFSPPHFRSYSLLTPP